MQFRPALPLTCNSIDGPVDHREVRRFTSLARTVAAIAVCASAASLYAAQDPWERVRSLTVGTPLVITTTSGFRLEGNFERAIDDEVTVAFRSGGQRRIARADVHMVSTVIRDPVWNGILTGAALGFGGGSALGAAWFYGSGRYGAKPPGYAREFITGFGVLGSIAGSFIGWRMDAARQRTNVIYEPLARPRRLP